MTRIKYAAFFLIALVFSQALPLLAQGFNANDAFNRGLILYRNKDYDQAKIQFLTLSARETDNPLQTAGLLMLSKTFLALKDNENALLYADQLISEFPKSSYTAFAHFVKACVLYDEKDTFSALSELTSAVEASQKQEFQYRCESAATELIGGGVQIKQLERLYKGRNWVKARPILSIWRAQLHHQNGESDKALDLINEFIESRPEQRYRVIAEKLKAQFEQNPTTRFRIGIVQPVSGFFSTEAKDFLRGMAFALKQRKNQSPKIELLLGDSKGTFAETVKTTIDLIDMDVDLIVGELEGDKSAMMAGLLYRTDIPLVIPITTDNQLTDLQSSIFQTNSSQEVRGAALAKYAVGTLHMKTFATLAPTDEYGNGLTDAFTNAVDRLGGTIVSQQWYSSGTTDFSRQLESIREAGFRYTVKDSLRALGRDVEMSRIDSLYSRMDRSVRFRSENREGLAKMTNIPMTAIDGIFLPMYEEDIPYIASQFALYNIKAGLLGGDYWYNLEELRKQQRYLEGIIFMSGYYFSETDLDYINFVRDFRTATSTSPGVMASYGYNVMNLLLNGIDGGQTMSSAITDYLSGEEEFQGLGTTISFRHRQRVNQYVNILQFLNGNIYKMNGAE